MTARGEERGKSKSSSMKRYDSWREGNLLPPQKVYISPTGGCNLRCSYCVHTQAAHREQHYDSDEDAELLLRLLNEALQMGVGWFNIVGGGEPFLKKDLALRMMRTIRENDADGAITTNAVLVDDEILQALVEMRWNNLVVSLDSHDEETADELRGKGVYEHCLRVLQRLRTLKTKSRSSLPCVELNSVITSRNYTHVEGILRFAADYGVGKVTFTPVTVHSDSQGHLKLSEREAPEFQEVIRENIPLAKRLGINTNLSALLDTRITTDTGKMVTLLEDKLGGEKGERTEEEKDINISRLILKNILSHISVLFGNVRQKPHMERPLCFDPWDSLVILPSGYVNPCQVSNLVSHAGERPLEDIWNSDEYLESMRERHARKDLPDFCEKCCSALIAEKIRQEEQSEVSG